MNKKTFWFLALIILFGALIRIFFFYGVGTSDDLLYSYYANKLATNQYTIPTDHHGTRLGFVYPLSFLYVLFGVNDLTSTLYSFIFSLGNILLFYYLGKLFFDEKTGLLSAFLFSFFPLDIIFATKLMPDVPSMFFLGLGMYLFFKAEKHSKNVNTNVLYFISGLSLGVSYLLRENTILMLIFFVSYSLFYKKLKLSYSLIALGFLILLVVEMYAFYLHTGDPFYRSSTVNKHYLEIWPVENYYGRGTISGFLFAFPYIIFRDIQLGLFYPFIIIALSYCVIQKRKETYPLVLWFSTLLLYLFYGTVSLSKYLPFPAISRYLMIVHFPAILTLSYFLTRHDKTIKILKTIVITVLLFTSLGFAYLEKINHNLNKPDYLYSYIEDIDFPIYTDTRTKMFLEYQSGYTKNNLKEFSYCGNAALNCTDNKSFALQPEQIKNSYILINYRMIKSLSSIHAVTNFPAWTNNPPQEWEIINKGKDWTLYRAK